MGLTMIYGVLRILHVAHAAVYALGAYAGFTVYVTTGNIILAGAFAIAASIAAGHLIQRFVYRAGIRQAAPYSTHPKRRRLFVSKRNDRNCLGVLPARISCWHTLC